ncbi:MAG: hypothetical protein PUC82_04900 [bacterium]|nr:hypothetical protein [bacterium]
MNNMPFPYLIPYQPTPIPNIEEEIKKLKYDIKILKEKVENLEKKGNKNYLQKEEGKYMM